MSTQSTIIIEEIPGHLLQDNPLGDPAVRRTPVYLPPGYEAGDSRYPVVYLLVGFTGSGEKMLNVSGFDENIQEQMDRLIAGGDVRPMILVMPDCFTRYGGSQYINSGATGPYEDYLIKEVIPYIDQKYRTGGRAIAGKSSGGYAALVHGMRHPDLFQAVACHSGDLYFEYCYKGDFPHFLDVIARNGLDSAEALAQFLADLSPKQQPKPSGFFDMMNMLAMAACYSPNPDSPYGFDLPCDLHTGKLRPAVWERWLAWDPITMLDRAEYSEALRGMKLLYLECGNRDEYALHYGARIFCDRLNRLGIPHTYEEFEGGHRHTQYRYDVSLRMISEAFEK